MRKFTHRYTDSNNQTQYMYYHRLIINFRKTAPAHPYFLHILVDIPQDGSDLRTYPKNFTGVYIIAYAILGRVSDVDADNVYDYHAAFDIKPTEVSFSVDINANQKAIRNIKLERNSNNSASIVGMVKELYPLTTNNVYRQYFDDFYDFSDGGKYKLRIGVSGVTFTGVNPNITFPTKDLSVIKHGALNVNNFTLTQNVTHSLNFTICVVMDFSFINNFSIHPNARNNFRSRMKLHFNKRKKAITFIYW